MNRTIKKYVKINADAGVKYLGRSQYLTKTGRVAKRPTNQKIEVFTEKRNVKHIEVYEIGRYGVYNKKTRVIDTPANQLTKSQLKVKVKDVQFASCGDGLLMRAVLA